jgi:hypothetical protein
MSETTPKCLRSSVRSQRGRPKMRTSGRGWPGSVVSWDDGVELAVHGADEGGFAAAVGAEDGDVFAGLDGEVDVVEDDAVAGGYVDVAHVEEGMRTGGGRIVISYRVNVGGP